MPLIEYRRLTLAAFWIAIMFTVGVFFAFIPNIELITTLAFLAGVAFGHWGGMAVAMTGEALFSSLNPLGSGLAFPILLFLQVLSVGLSGWMGGIFAHRKIPEHSLALSVSLAGIGLILTLLYDFLTALSLPLTAGMEDQSFWAATLAGLPFFATHMGSNTLLFGLFMPELVGFVKRMLSMYGFTSVEDSAG